MDKRLYTNFDAPKIRYAIMDTFDEVQVVLPEPVSLHTEDTGGFKIFTSDGQSLAIREVIADNPHQTWTVTILLRDVIDVTQTYLVYHSNFQPVRVRFRRVLDDERFIYSEDDLGVTYNSQASTFRVWAPTANRVELLLYECGDSVDCKSLEMQPSVQGTWVLTVSGDFKGRFYTYRVHVHGYVREAVDPYARSVNVNGTKGAIIDMTETYPIGWGTVSRPYLENYVDAIIYETHIRDLSMSASSGIQHKGKYLALTEENTQSEEGYATGLQHLKDLGITHLHLLPIMESHFIMDNENHYNWGYGTNFFFAAEGQYVTDPQNPVLRVKELKEAIQVLHQNGIRVVLDVVYNHTGREKPDLERIVPGYYLRRDEKGHLSCGSGVNNDFASERPMARKLMVDSVKYWVSEYQVDGFRFDLMGLHDRETMLAIEKELHQIEPTVLLYGEAWNIPSGDLPLSKMMVKNSQHGTSFAIFNDNVRDAFLKGGLAPVSERGFANGRPGLEGSVKKAVVASIIDYDPDHIFNVEYQWAPQEIIQTLAPHETINYVTCHDNYTLRDRLERSNSEVADEDRMKMGMLANGMVLTCQGIPFLQGGVELWKTKHGDENSYKSPDSINAIDWSEKKRYYKMFQYYQGLIRLRKEHPAFRMTTAEQIKKNLLFHQAPHGMVIFSLNNYANGDRWRTILVLYNQNHQSMTVHVPYDCWKVVVEDGIAGVVPLRIVQDNLVKVPSISIMVMFHD